jgi:AAHS family 4-hydroxybenzoate transporter-like MFS transporter
MIVLLIMLDGYDLQVAAFASPALKVEWGLTTGQLGPVLAAALVGMALGTGLGGVLGDRWGRRPALLSGTAGFGLFACLSALAPDAFALTGLRFVTGIGLGIVLPNAAALISESVSERWRNQAVTLVVVASPLGGMVGAALSSEIIPMLGWRASFALGGSLPLLLCLSMYRWLPESPAFRPGRSGAGSQSGMGLLSPRWRQLTMGLWLAFFGSMMMLYSWLSWLPLLLVANGIVMADALRGSMLFNMFGVIGALGCSWLVARHGARQLLVISCGLAGLAVTLMAGELDASTSYARAMAIVALAGTSVLTIQVVLYALVTRVYPSIVRAGAVGWASSIGRLGAISSALGGGLLLQQQSGEMWFFVALGGGVSMVLAGTLLIGRHGRPATDTL